MNIGFIGLGKLGLPCAEVIASKGHNVYGYDTNEIYSDRITVVESIKVASYNKDIVFIAVPTPHSNEYDGKEPTSHLAPKDFDYTTVISVISDVVKCTNDNTLIVLISTVLPGTIRKHIAPIINNRRFLYNPYLIAMGTVAFDMVNPEMVIIGANDHVTFGYEYNVDVEYLKSFYKGIMENSPRYETGTWEEAESIKIFYNTWISSKLALVNMMQDVAERLGNINVDVVTTALAKSTYRIAGEKYMTAGLGDAGACHPRDNIALRSMAQELDLGYDIFHAIMNARDKQALNMAKLIASYDLPAIIVGKSYKPGVPYSAGSVSILTGEWLKQLGTKVYYIDNDDCDDQRDSEEAPIDKPAVYLLAHSNEVTYDGKVKSEDIQFVPATGSVFVDPWRRNLIIEGCTVYNYGNTRNRTK